VRRRVGAGGAAAAHGEGTGRAEGWGGEIERQRSVNPYTQLNF
jgi:hypothetical protein